MLEIVVDDIACSSNSPQPMKKFKSNLSPTLSVKLFGESKPFVGSTINTSDTNRKVDQRNYERTILKEHGIETANALHTPLPVHANITSKGDD